MSALQNMPCPCCGKVHDTTACHSTDHSAHCAVAVGSAPTCDITEDAEYQKFVEGMAQHCRCRANNCPCDGVLAGGLCDMLQEEEPWPSYDEDEI